MGSQALTAEPAEPGKNSINGGRFGMCWVGMQVGRTAYPKPGGKQEPELGLGQDTQPP